MGLDVYVGPIARYLAGDWQTILEQAAPGMVHVVRPGPSGSDAALDEQIARITLDVVRNRGESWETSSLVPAPMRDFILANPRVHEPPFDATTDLPEQAVFDWIASFEGAEGWAGASWDEDPDAGYETDKPGWSGYEALILWAAYEENPQFVLPARLPGELLEDPAYLANMDSDESRYEHLIDAEIWLPVDARGFQVGAPLFPGREVGSSFRLLEELETLNRRTWKADEKVLGAWASSPPSPDGGPEDWARFGFALFHRLAKHSVQRKLPMLLDH